MTREVLNRLQLGEAAGRVQTMKRPQNVRLATFVAPQQRRNARNVDFAAVVDRTKILYAK